jgi:predicted membrane GTPase involved in stress response
MMLEIDSRLTPILLQVSPPKIGDTDSLQMMVTNLDYDQHKGRLAIGRVNSGKLIKGQTVAICKPGAEEGIVTKREGGGLSQRQWLGGTCRASILAKRVQQG